MDVPLVCTAQMDICDQGSCRKQSRGAKCLSPAKARTLLLEQERIKRDKLNLEYQKALKEISA